MILPPRILACALLAALPAMAQQPAPPAPPAPVFAAPNLGDKGISSMAATCAACHGTRGRVVEGSAVAGLAGRPAPELVKTMGEFKSGQRPATVMHQIAKGFGDAEIAALAEYFSRQARQEAR